MVKAERKGKSCNGKSPVIVTTLENREQVTEVLKSKKALTDCQTYKRVFIHGDVDSETRTVQANTMATLKAMGKD